MNFQQQDLFDRWCSLCLRLNDLGGSIQNDFIKLYEDGFITKEQILKNLYEVQNKYLELVPKLERCFQEIRKYTLKIHQDIEEREYNEEYRDNKRKND